MAPELLGGSKRKSMETDVYAFGIVLYEIYSRETPYADMDYDEVLEYDMEPFGRFATENLGSLKWLLSVGYATQPFVLRLSSWTTPFEFPLSTNSNLWRLFEAESLRLTLKHLQI